MVKYKILDLFCGAGGFSYGMDKNPNFETLIALDNDQYAGDTFKRNMPYVEVIIGDITKEDTKKEIIDKAKLFFIEAKKTNLTLRDLGQLWAYCKLIDPEEAWLFSSCGIGSLQKLLLGFNREDLLDFGKGKKIKKMKVGVWDIRKQLPDFNNIFPKI